MNKLSIAVLCLALALPFGAAMADPPWKEKGRERQVGLDDGVCKVERKWGKKGEYKEEIKCRGARPGSFQGYGSSSPRYGYSPPAYRYDPPPAYWYGYR